MAELMHFKPKKITTLIFNLMFNCQLIKVPPYPSLRIRLSFSTTMIAHKNIIIGIIILITIFNRTKGVNSIAEMVKLQMPKTLGGGNNAYGMTQKMCDRSEEHTSELQSRGLISYAVFCLKKIFF